MIQTLTLRQAETIINSSEIEHSLFHSYDWLSILSQTQKAEPQVILFKDKKTILGYIPIFQKKIGLKVLFSPPFSSETAYGGIVARHPEKLYSELKQAGDFFVVHPAKIKAEGVICEPKFTILTALNATSGEEHFSRLKKGHRYNIRKAEKDNILKISYKVNDTSLKKYYGLLEKTYRGFKPLPFEFYKAIITHYERKGMCRFALAQKGNTAIGTICAIFYREKLHYWTGGFLREPEYTKLYPNDLLQWDVIKWGYEKELKVYDMLGADIEGIRNFKLGFGGELVEYTRIFSSRKLHLLSRAYSMAGQRIKSIVRS